MRDWTGNEHFFRSGNNRKEGIDNADYYATEPKAVEMLLRAESFAEHIWEPACGEGHISKVLERYGHRVTSTDLIDRGYGSGSIDFLNTPFRPSMRFDIITNPPYKFALEFCERALAIVPEGGKVAMFLKLTFLEGKKRQRLFSNNPPQFVYVFPARVCCGKNGVFNTAHNAVAYAWFVWKKGIVDAPQVKWLNEDDT